MGWNDLIGMRLDQYDILGELGRGGSSRVYHAHDITLDRDVAIKVIPNDADDRALFTSRFAREVEAVRKLHHPNIVAVYGAGENDEFVYLVMQGVTGGTLRKQLNGPLPAPIAVAYMVQMAYALHHAHQQGIIHRDVKPSNMLLASPGSNHLLLTDFGIAKIQGARGLTKSGTTIGTPEYMSPEQAEGREIDERSDIYALGCVLYEALAGRPPFLGSTPVSVLFQQVHSRPAYIRGFNPGVPAELVHILEIALAKRPDERYGTAEAFARALMPFAGELPDISGQQSESVPIVITRSRGLTPSRPLPKDQRLTENDVADRDTLENHPAIPRAGIYDEPTAPLPLISARKTMPPAPHRHHGALSSNLRRTAPPGRSHKTAPLSRVRKTIPPFARLRRAAPLSEWNLPLGTPESMPAETPTSPLASMPQQLADSGQPQEPIRLQLGSSRLREERVGAGGTRTGDETQAQGQRGPNSHPGTMRSKPDDKGTPAEWPRRRKRGRCLITFIVALLVPVMFALLALNVSGLGSAFGGILQHPTATHRPTATTATPTTAPTVTPAPTYTAAPQSTATPSQQQILNQQAYASFRSVVLGTFSDGTCSSANARSSFSRNQAIYINLCTSSKAVSAPMTITIRQGGKVVYTWAYGYYISPSASYYFVTSHGFSPGTYDVQVTLKISGTTAVARDLALSIK